ncbi:MAG TPA: efflux RND transporter periplasmic adaptor subunit [Longimicrobiaceae bacterium]|nr:efflux RND transporter periplasmic adaptor subunit [Longimicrobiaceae bacterium]
MKTRTILIAGGVVALAGGGIAARSALADRGTEVRTEVVARRDLTSIVTASGTIDPKRRVDISADISGRVIELTVEEGEWVNRGDLLLRIDPTAYQAAVRRAEAAVAQAQARAAQARANLLQAQSAARRADQLSRSSEQLISAADAEQARTQAAVAQAELEAARFGVAQAQAGLSEAREALRKTTIVAPMSGRVTRLNIEEGETAIVGTMNNPGSLLLTVADLSVMEARVRVDETDVPDIQVGDSARVRIDAFPDRVFPGTVTRIANSSLRGATAGLAAGGGSEQQSVDFEVVVTLADPPEQLRPDLSATADIVTETRRNALSVPIIALTVRDPRGKKLDRRDTEEEQDPAASARNERERKRAEEEGVEGVFVVRGDSVAFVPVKVGIPGDRYFEVESGLRGGEIVVSGTYQAIRELESGSRIRAARDGEEKAGKGKG